MCRSRDQVHAAPRRWRARHHDSGIIQGARRATGKPLRGTTIGSIMAAIRIGQMRRDLEVDCHFLTPDNWLVALECNRGRVVVVRRRRLARAVSLIGAVGGKDDVIVGVGGDAMDMPVSSTPRPRDGELNGNGGRHRATEIQR